MIESAALRRAPVDWQASRRNALERTSYSYAQFTLPLRIWSISTQMRGISTHTTKGGGRAAATEAHRTVRIRRHCAPQMDCELRLLPSSWVVDAAWCGLFACYGVYKYFRMCHYSSSKRGKWTRRARTRLFHSPFFNDISAYSSR